jgi:pyruvate,water dikinase
LVAAPALPGVTTVIQGIGAAAGQVEGIAVVARRSQDLPTPLPPHAIVVLPDLQPDVFLELGAVAGIVTERGGATCHAAILAREIGIPAVVGAPQVTEFLQSGAVVWLDGNRGLVYELPEASAPSSVSSPARQTSPLAPSVRSYSDSTNSGYG